MSLETAQAVPANGIELSVVMPCLNEADTLAACLRKANQALRDHQIEGEIIVADNGSTDGSQAIAQEHGARVVAVQQKGYGNALMGGIAAARGKYVIMGDADDSYDFLDIPKFLAKLREGCELVQGCRLPDGGGSVVSGAMPWSHRWIGNPMFTWLARNWFQAPIHDVYCGLRGFQKSLFERLDQRCTGMEFATEMIIKASLYRVKIGEVPITLHPDGRKNHPPHLKTYRDGWRTLRFFLIYSPWRLYLGPGMLLLLAGLLGYGLAMPRVSLGGVAFDAHTLLFASVGMICGYQSMLFGLFTKVFGVNERLLPPDAALARFLQIVTIERGLVLGVGLMAAGAMLLVLAVSLWKAAHFGALDYPTTMRVVIPGVMFTTLGFQTVLAAFFVGLLNLSRR